MKVKTEIEERRYPNQGEQKMVNGSTMNFPAYDHLFRETANIEIREEDPANPDDLLGTIAIFSSLKAGKYTQQFKKRDSSYELKYQIIHLQTQGCMQ